MKTKRERGIDFVIINLGLFLVAAGIHFFKVPNHFAIGGTSGIAIVLKYFFENLSVGPLLYIINAVLIVLGFIFVGVKFTSRTIYSSIMLSTMVAVMEKLRKSWARLIQKIYQVDPLVCPKCQGVMQIISFIEDQQVIRDILTHLELWLFRSRPPPKMRTAVTLSESKTSDSFAHTPHPQADYYADPEYSCDDYIQS